MVHVLNISTGIFPLNGSSQIGAPVTCITSDGLGKLLWAGDDRVGYYENMSILIFTLINILLPSRAILFHFWWIQLLAV